MRKNVFAMMMVALFATAFVSCSEDSDDEINNEEPQKVESLVSTQWRYRVGTIGQNGFIQVFVSFINDVSAAVSINKQEGGTPTAKAMGGSYTYSDGRGSIECKDLTNGTAMGTATFTIKDNTMAFTYDNETYTLTKVGSDNGDDNGGNNNTTQTYEPINTKVLAATFPQNVRIEMTHQPSYNNQEETTTLIKLGNEWFYKNVSPRYIIYLYCEFDKNGNTLKAYGKTTDHSESYDEAHWVNLLESGDDSYLHFAGYAKNSEINVLFDAGVPAGNCKKYGEATSDKQEILGVECTRYDYDFVVKADYWVDEATKIVYKFVNYLDDSKEQPNARFEIVGWDDTVTSFDWKKP